jgi:galactonate dehydratase
MRISDIECVHIFAEWRNWLIVRVSTTEGLVGLGEATLEGCEKAVAAAVGELSRRLRGRDPADIEALYQLMYRGSYWRGGPVLCSAISGLEQAFWDILGKKYSTPVYRLLGGPVRARIPVYASGWFRRDDRTIDALVKRAVDTVASGFRAIKAPCFLPWDTCVSERMLLSGIELVAELRKALEPDVELSSRCTAAIRSTCACEPSAPWNPTNRAGWRSRARPRIQASFGAWRARPGCR